VNDALDLWISSLLMYYLPFATTSACMPSAPLTSAFVRTATCPPDRVKLDFFDPSQKGFLLEVRASGGKTFYQRYFDAYGRQRQFKLGSAAVLSLEQARRLGRSAVAEALLGSDPQARRHDRRSIPTLNDWSVSAICPTPKPQSGAGRRTRPSCASTSCPDSARSQSTRSAAETQHD
jgi:Arm DNA-binding domain